MSDEKDIRNRYKDKTRLGAEPLRGATKYRTRADGLIVVDEFGGVADMSDDKKNDVPVVPRPGLIDLLNPPTWVKLALGVLLMVVVSVIGTAESGTIALGSGVLLALKIVSGILSALGITSAGVTAAQKKDE